MTGQPGKKITRRAAITLTTGALAAVALGGPGGAAVSAVGIEPAPGSIDAVPPEVRRTYAVMANRLRGRLRVLREAYDEAGALYRATGDGAPIDRVRMRARNEFGFHLGFEAVTERDRATFREVGAFLLQLEREFPQVPWDAGMKPRYAKLRGWAEAGGQFAFMETQHLARGSV